MKLSTRILVLAAVNILLLLALAATLARYEYGVGLQSFLLAPAHDRAETVAREVAFDLQQTPQDSRTALMGRYAAEYGADFYLFRNDGAELAGRPINLPEAVHNALRGSGPPPPPRDDDRRPPPPDGFDDRPPPPRRGPPPDRRGEIRLFELSAGGLYWVGARIPIPSDDAVPVRGSLLIAAKSFYGTPLFFDFKPWLLALCGVIAIFTLCWLPFIRGLTRTISRITRATELIAEGRFDHQLNEKRSDELGQLSTAINRLASKLSGFVTGQKRFLGDIAHELCAPIARMQFGLGILEHQSDESQRAGVNDVQDEMRQMSNLVNELLAFSKAGMEGRQKRTVRVDILEIARSAVSREGFESNDAIRLEIPDGLAAMADYDYLVRSVSNLIRNSVRYAGSAGPVTVSGRHEGSEVVVTVSDCGAGIPEVELERVFAPFYRVETSRAREAGGAGLGLAIVKSCVEACEGTVACRNLKPRGFQVEIRLKAA